MTGPLDPLACLHDRVPRVPRETAAESSVSLRDPTDDISVLIANDIYSSRPATPNLRFIRRSIEHQNYFQIQEDQGRLSQPRDFYVGSSDYEREGEFDQNRRTGKEERQMPGRKKEGWIPSSISILIELNATSYLMPEARQKLQLKSVASLWGASINYELTILHLFTPTPEYDVYVG